MKFETYGEMLTRVLAPRFPNFRRDQARAIRAERSKHPFGSPARTITIGWSRYRAAMRGGVTFSGLRFA